MRAILYATAALAALSPAAAHAAQPTPVDELIVTATRLATPVDLVTGARVIERVELEARQTPFATEVLSTVPGVGVARSGAFGGVAAIRIRGAAPDKTLVLIDGVPVGDPADPNGTYDPSSLQLADIERIEVLSGPQSSLWGSEAIGGVVSFTTRELDGWRAEAEAGRHQTWRGFAGAGVSTAAYGLSGSLTGFRTDGISKADARNGARERDGFQTISANLAGRIALAEGVRLEGRLRYGEAQVDIDGYPAPAYLLGDTPDRNKSRTWSGLARLHAEQASGLTHEISLGAYDLDRKNLSAFPSRYTADRQLLRYTLQKGAPDAGLGWTAGVERAQSHAELDTRGALRLDDTSAFAVLRWRPAAPLTLTGSLRYDDPDRFNGRATGRLSAALALPAGFTATASAGQGFKSPTVSQVLCDFCFAAPVPLKTETAEGYDLRLGWNSGDGGITAALTGYRLNVRDQIAYRGGRYVNIARTRSKGLEAETQARLTDAVTVKLSYAWTDAVDLSTGGSLLRVPDQSGAAVVYYDQGAWSAALTVRGESSQADTARDGFSPAVRKGFVTADLAGAYAVNERLSLTARLENLADERFQEVLGYGEPGRALYLGLKLRN